MEAGEESLAKDEFWKAHILKAQEFSGSNSEYCRANDLSRGIFYEYKKRLGFGRRPKKRRSAFVEVAAVGERLETVSKGRDGRMPDPKWVAHFVTALMMDR
jgi:hypothetical protein